MVDISLDKIEQQNKQTYKPIKGSTMKKQTTTIAIASIFALTALIASAATHLNDRELGIGEYNEQASFNSPRLDDRELGIGEYNEQA
jgi:hypothetical protein